MSNRRGRHPRLRSVVPAAGPRLVFLLRDHAPDLDARVVELPVLVALLVQRPKDREAQADSLNFEGTAVPSETLVQISGSNRKIACKRVAGLALAEDYSVVDTLKKQSDHCQTCTNRAKLPVVLEHCNCGRPVRASVEPRLLFGSSLGRKPSLLLLRYAR